jgi:hypothetical protein
LALLAGPHIEPFQASQYAYNILRQKGDFAKYWPNNCLLPKNPV